MSVKRARFSGGRFSQLDRNITPAWWLAGKQYGSNVPGKKGVRSNINARVRRGLERLEKCALERLAHRRASSDRRRASVAGQNLAQVAAWASRHKNEYGNMGAAIQAGWALARSPTVGYVKGSRQRFTMPQ